MPLVQVVLELHTLCCATAASTASAGVAAAVIGGRAAHSYHPGGAQPTSWTFITCCMIVVLSTLVRWCARAWVLVVVEQQSSAEVSSRTSWPALHCCSGAFLRNEVRHQSSNVGNRHPILVLEEIGMVAVRCLCLSQLVCTLSAWLFVMANCTSLLRISCVNMHDLDRLLILNLRWC